MMATHLFNTNKTSMINSSLFNYTQVGWYVAVTDETSTIPLDSEVVEEVVEIPSTLRFNEDELMSVLAYSALFVIAATGNLTVFLTLVKHRKKSRVNWFIMHLAIADMIVTFVMMPLEVAWHLTVSWRAGDAACRIFMFLRVFGFYLSSSILIVICLDRYNAISKPLSLRDAKQRGQIMVVFAWSFSFIASIPQSVIFHVEAHPIHPWFKQCVTFNFFPTPAHELVYNLFNMTAMYIAPLVVIIVTFLLIFYQIYLRSRTAKRCERKRSQSIHLRASSRNGGIVRHIQRAKIRTLKMTAIIVLVFLTCWTPYFVISAWWWIDKESASLLNPKIQRILFIFAVSNSCVNPIVYGVYTRTVNEQITKMLRCIKFPQTRPSTVDWRTQSEDLPLQRYTGPQKPQSQTSVTSMPFVIVFNPASSASSTDSPRSCLSSRRAAQSVSTDTGSERSRSPPTCPLEATGDRWREKIAAPNINGIINGTSKKPVKDLNKADRNPSRSIYHPRHKRRRYSTCTSPSLSSQYSAIA